MSSSTRNRRFSQKQTKKVKNTAVEQPSKGRGGKQGGKAKNHRHLRPESGEGTKTRAVISTPKTASKFDRADLAANLHWIWGHHAAKAALHNPRRSLHRIYVTHAMAVKLAILQSNFNKTEVTLASPAQIGTILPRGSVHQGIAIACAPLPPTQFSNIEARASGLLIVLDQITDPHNVGAIFRLAAAFKAQAVLMQTRRAPPLSGAAAKVAAGAVESVPHVLVTNIANTLLELQKSDWRVTGLAGEAKLEIKHAFQQRHADVLVLGAEGAGLRKRVKACCDQIAKIPMPGGAESLNVSTAAAIAMYEARRET